jgi:hypothetical protein
MTGRPPLVMLAGTWTTHYALLGRGGGFNGRGRIFIGDTLLGRVPRLAIATTAAGRWWLMHCGRTWNVRTASDYSSLADAQAAAERRYPGSEARWLRTGYTQARAEAYVNRASRGHTCSFCGRRPDQMVEQMFVAKRNAARVCDQCVDDFGTLRTKYRRALDAQQERLLNTVSRRDPVRFVVRSRFLVLLDFSTFDVHREALAAMAPLDETGRRRALDSLTPSRRIGVRVFTPFTPGLYRVRPADMEAAAGQGRDLVAVESGAIVLVDLDALPAVAGALTRERYDALTGNTDRGTTALQLWKDFGGPRFAVLQGGPRRAFSGQGRFRLRPGAPVLVSADGWGLP